MNFAVYVLIITSIVSSSVAGERNNIALDIYNRDQAFVKEQRTVYVKKGMNSIDFHKIADGIYGHTAQVKPLEADVKVQAMSVSYNFDLVSHEKIMKKYIGQWFSFETEDQDYYGRLLGFDDSHLFLQPDTSDKLLWVVERGKMTDLFYPELPEGLFTEPTLRWEIDATRKYKKLPVEICYLTSDIYWVCDYRAELMEGNLLNIAGYFTIRNDLLLSYPDAQITLVAGETHRSEDPEGGDSETAPLGSGGELSCERLFEYYRYKLENPLDLRAGQTIQVPFFEGREVQAERRFVFPHLLENNQVNIIMRFNNAAGNGLGEALPEGDIGIYKRAEDRSLHFIGEDVFPATETFGLVRHGPTRLSVDLKLWGSNIVQSYH